MRCSTTPAVRWTSTCGTALRDRTRNRTGFQLRAARWASRCGSTPQVGCPARHVESASCEEGLTPGPALLRAEQSDLACSGDGLAPSGRVQLAIDRDRL